MGSVEMPGPMQEQMAAALMVVLTASDLMDFYWRGREDSDKKWRARLGIEKTDVSKLTINKDWKPWAACLMLAPFLALAALSIGAFAP